MLLCKPKSAGLMQETETFDNEAGIIDKAYQINALNCNRLDVSCRLTPSESMTKTTMGDTTDGPRQANLLLIAYASSEGSGEPAHPRSLARTSAARS